DAGPQVDGDAADVVPAQLDLPRMQSHPNLDPFAPEGLPDGHRAPDRSGRTVEQCEEAVAGGLHLPSAVAGRRPPAPRVGAGRRRRAGSRGIGASWRSSSARQLRSPIAAARSVEETMSLNITVASTRSVSEPVGRTGPRSWSAMAEMSRRVTPGDRRASPRAT